MPGFSLSIVSSEIICGLSLILHRHMNYSWNIWTRAYISKINYVCISVGEVYKCHGFYFIRAEAHRFRCTALYTDTVHLYFILRFSFASNEYHQKNAIPHTISVLFLAFCRFLLSLSLISGRRTYFDVICRVGGKIKNNHYFLDSPRCKA